MDRLAPVHAYARCHATSIIQELADFVSQPNNVYIASEIQANAQWLKRMMERRGIAVELWPTESGRPAVYGELISPGAELTVLIYGHYDGVPVEREAWHSDPYTPVLRSHLPAGPGADWSTIPFPADGRFADEWRLFGRSVADSKNAIVALLTALDSLRAAGVTPGVNLKLLFDGEEEAESPGLPACLEAHKERLAADLMIGASGEAHQSGLPTLQFGVRGILMFDLTVYTTTVDLHSGHFGNFAPSAIFPLAQLLTSMKDADGRVSIAGFYEEALPLSPREQQAIAAIPRIEASIQAQFGIASPEVEGRLLQELINEPTLNIRGIAGGFVGEAARNIIPGQATADFDLRLVKGMDPERTFAKVVAHIERQGWRAITHQPSREELLANDRLIRVQMRAGFPATRTPMDSPLAIRLVQLAERAVSEPVVIMPSDGGSLPMYLFAQMGIPYVGLPTSNFDCNQHTHDENLKLKDLFRGIGLFASILMG